MNAPLSHYLVSFSPEPSAAIVVSAPTYREPMVTLSVAEIDARLAETRESARHAADAGRAIERASLAEEHEARLASELATARAEWCAIEGERITGLVEQAFATLQDNLASQLANVMRPLLADAVRARASAVLADAVARLLDDPSHPAITVTGPADLVAAIGAGRDGLALVVAETREASVTAGGASIETKLSAALADLAATEA